MRNGENTKQIAFFNKLLALTEKAYIASDVYKTYKEKNWGYSLTSTNLDKNKPVIIGFNWGAGKHWSQKYSAPVRQKEYPSCDFNGIPEDELGSLMNLKSYFREFYPEGLTAVQTNYCFFRSEFAEEISSNDLKLRCAPLFNALLEFLEPKILIGFSMDLYKHFQNEKLIDPGGEKKITYRSGKSYRSLTIYKGKVSIGNNKVDFCSLPHPNYQLRNEIRRAAWKYCFNDS